MTADLSLGVNLSFCVKRWITPELWAPLVRERLGLDFVQYSLDLTDPMWPTAILDRQAEAIRRETEDYGIGVHSAFIGLAHYTYNQMLHPDPAVRDYAETWLARAYAFAANAGIAAVGGPLGAIASRIDGHEAEEIPARDYDDLVSRMLRLAQRARSEGLSELFVEPTPMRREWPWTIDQARRMMTDVAGSAVPWKLCVDWGHGTHQPLYGPQVDNMMPWFTGLSDVIGAVHIQQTDFQFDRHWDFTEEGLVDPAQSADELRRAGLAHVPVFLEVFYPFERDDTSILAALEASSQLLKRGFRTA
ncbi:TIM barrel protein [Rhizobium sp. FY34]|uniref:sugar phosphate isomerase/epimerase family protein n=1 Tax=Rhizobium sp. FY34 TaxID=2562309 RepID=UPI0010C092A6|nr:TIM barrel protein [Rhizobium sp. FY34]